MQYEIFGRTFSFFSDAGQWEKLLRYSLEFFLNPFTILACVAGLLFLGLFFSARRRKNSRLLALLRRAAPWVCMFIILMLSVCNRTPRPRSLNLWVDYFLTDGGFHESRVLMTAMDFVYFIPYGVLLKWRYPQDRLARPLLIASATGLAVELLQYVFSRGATSLGSWAAYTLGALAGIGLMAHWMRRQSRHAAERAASAPSASDPIDAVEPTHAAGGAEPSSDN